MSNFDDRIFVQTEILLPMLPNFFRTPDGQAIPISQLDPRSLADIGERWTKALIEHAQEQKRRYLQASETKQP